MTLVQLNESTYVFESRVNIGYVHKGNEGLMIDAGIDKSSIRKVVRQLEENHLPITHLFITHAHADHYGGAHYLKEAYDVKVIAPQFESVILAHPILEPIYLFSGNEPLPELRNKFLEGTPVEVDIIVEEGRQTIDQFDLEFIKTKGHSYNQLAVLVNGILFAADSYFGIEQLYDHKIPYITDAKNTIQSLKKLLNISCDGAVPGHGLFEVNYKNTIQKNIEYHEMIAHRLFNIIGAHPEGITHEQLIKKMCDEMNVETKELSQFLLIKTAITAYIILLINEGKIEHDIQHQCWMFQIY